MRQYSGYSNHVGKVITSEVGSSHDSLALFDFFPVFMGCVDTPRVKDLFSPMLWEHNRGTVVVKPILDSSLVYLSNHKEVVGSTWLDHHTQFANFVINNKKGERIYEIGGAHGMLSVLAKRMDNLEWLIHDINPCPVSEYRGEIKIGKFRRNPEICSNYSTIVHSHTLEHVNNPWEFLTDISLSQKIGDKQIFSIPNMDAMISRGDLNFLNFEHNYFVPIMHIRSMLRQLGYEINKEMKFRQHSIFLATTKVSEISVNASEFVFLNTREDLHLKFESYFNLIESQIAEMNAKISGFEGEVLLFGAHVFSQMLIAMGLKHEKIQYCLDNSQEKNGKRLYGTGLKVIRPSEILQDKKRQLVIGSLATYKHEVLNQLNALNPNAEVLIL